MTDKSTDQVHNIIEAQIGIGNLHKKKIDHLLLIADDIIRFPTKRYRLADGWTDKQSSLHDIFANNKNLHMT